MDKINRDRLVEAMRRAGMSQAELARRAGVSPATIQQIINGSIKRSRALHGIADALEVSDLWLQDRSDDPAPYLVISKQPSDEQISSVPYSLIENGQRKLKFLKVSTFWLTELTGQEAFSGYIMSMVFDGAMAPTLMPGDNMLMRLSKTFDSAAETIWLLEFASHVVLRRVRRLSEGRYRLSADNPMTPAVEADEGEVSFYGQVIWQGRKIYP